MADVQLGKDLKLKMELVGGLVQMSLVLQGDVQVNLGVGISPDILIDHMEALIPGDYDKLILEPVRAAIKAGAGV